jgi:hypothetical protein
MTKKQKAQAAMAMLHMIRNGLERELSEKEGPLAKLQVQLEDDGVYVTLPDKANKIWIQVHLLEGVE